VKEQNQKPQSPRKSPRGREENKRAEDEIRHPFDPGWLDRLPKQDDSSYRPWWVIDDPLPKPRS